MNFIVIAGATASGKSDIAYSLAKRLDTEIINADSMQVYRHFDIGTAKPSPEIQNEIPHHLIDIVNPDENFNAQNFCTLSTEIIKRLNNLEKIPIITGGTGLYLKSLIEGHSLAVKSDKKVRDKITKDFDIKGNQYMYDQLIKIDPIYAAKIHPNDRLRIERALEVFTISGKPFSYYSGQKKKDSINVKYFILERNRKELYERIETRVDIMLESGLITEVSKILNMGYEKNLKPFKSIGYSQIVEHLSGDMIYDTCVEKIKQETRNYAKRQTTWFKGVPYAQKIAINNNDKTEEIVNIIEKSC